jgi:hypothetical protein
MYEQTSYRRLGGRTCELLDTGFQPDVDDGAWQDDGTWEHDGHVHGAASLRHGEWY